MSLTGAAHWFGTFQKTDGTPYSGVRVFHYEPGTTTTRTAWTDEAATSSAADPVVGDTKGTVSFYGKGNYRLLVKSSVADGDLTLYDFDPLKLEDQPPGLRGELQDTSYPAATSANRGLMFYKTNVGGDVTEVGVNLDGSGFSALQFQNVAATATVSWAAGADLASASTLTLGSDGNSFLVTGSTTITAISAKSAGTIIILRFQSAISITHNGTSLILRDGKNASLQAGDVLVLGSLGSANWYEIARRSNDFLADPAIQDFRLTLTTATPVTTSDVTAAGTVYATPYKGNRVSLYNTTLAQWITQYYNELSIAVPATTSKMHDVFIYDNAGTGTLELVAWTNDTTRATALVLQNGVLCKTGDLTRRYLGSFRTTTVANQTEDSESKRFLWNYYHRVTRNTKAAFTTARTTTSGSAVEINSEIRNQFILGVAEDAVQMFLTGTLQNGSSSDTFSGIGIDGTTVEPGATRINNGATDAEIFSLHCYRAKILAVGYHYVTVLGATGGGSTGTWAGDGSNELLRCTLACTLRG